VCIDANTHTHTHTGKNYYHAYISQISFADWNLGRVLDALDASEHANNTVVCSVV
jgi:arylsulfatase A-like enzyme